MKVLIIKIAYIQDIKIFRFEVMTFYDDVMIFVDDKGQLQSFPIEDIIYFTIK